MAMLVIPSRYSMLSQACWSSMFRLTLLSRKYSCDSGQPLVVDLRSDTVTKPSRGMRLAMAEAEVGDDVYREDPTVLKFEERVASLSGKERALFVPTGTMGNLIAVLAHCRERGLEVLLGDKSHIFIDEVAGIAQFGGLQPHIVHQHTDGSFNLEELTSKIRIEDIHFPVTGLICLENTFLHGGKALTLKYINEVSEIAKAHSLPLHMDGARVMNAVVKTGEPLSSIVEKCNSVCICFSKGLGTPSGSVIVGSTEFMERAIRLRKALGGGMRQVGILAAAGLYALDHMVQRLEEDHRHAAVIAKAIQDVGSAAVSCSPSDMDTNMVFASVNSQLLKADDICARLMQVTADEVDALKERIVVRALPFTPTLVRFVTHCDINDHLTEAAVMKISYVLRESEFKTP